MLVNILKIKSEKPLSYINGKKNTVKNTELTSVHIPNSYFIKLFYLRNDVLPVFQFVS